MDTEDPQPDLTPSIATGVADTRHTPLGKIAITGVLDRIRPAIADPTKPAVAAFNSSL